jgi:signal transduction histidine kinase
MPMISVRQRVMVLVSLLAFGFVVTATAWQLVGERDAGRLAQNAAVEKKQLFDQIVDLKGARLQALAADYTFWDELAGFTRTGDRPWAREILEPSLATYHVSGIWVYDRQQRLVYGVQSPPAAGLKQLDLPPAAFSTLFARAPFSHCFIQTPAGILELRGATIHRSTDQERKGRWFGYFFAGQLWDRSYLRDVERLTGTRIQLLPPETPAAAPRTRAGRMEFTASLNGWNGAPVAELGVTTGSALLGLLHQMARRSVALLGLFVVVLLGLLFVALWRWVSVPLGQIGRSLQAEDPESLRRLERDRSEFGQLARLIRAFFEQKAALTREVGERQQAETALRHSQEQLLQAQKMEAVGRLAGGIAHDFNNMLAVINGHSELLLGVTRPGDPVYRGLEEIRKASQRAAALTAQLLAFSRKQVLAPQVVDLNEIVRNMAEVLRRLIGEHIQLATSLEPDLGRVQADPGQLAQVMMNLAINARDAMPHGGRLTIETRNADWTPSEPAGTAPTETPALAAGPAVLLAVSDTGTGMDADVRAHLFEPFFTTKGSGQGAGLGLATVYGVVRQSGGAIEVDSAPGRGSVFRIYLPWVEPAASAPAALTAPVGPGSESILLVEDEEMVRELVAEVLRGHGYALLEASDGETALARATAHPGPIHLLLTDVVMPGIGGRELAERLTALRPETRVLFMSGYTEDEVIRLGLLDTGAEFIKKPFPLDVLARKVQEVLAAGPRAGLAVEKP